MPNSSDTQQGRAIGLHPSSLVITDAGRIAQVRCWVAVFRDVPVCISPSSLLGRLGRQPRSSIHDMTEATAAATIMLHCDLPMPALACGVCWVLVWLWQSSPSPQHYGRTWDRQGGLGPADDEVYTQHVSASYRVCTYSGGGGPPQTADCGSICSSSMDVRRGSFANGAGSRSWSFFFVRERYTNGPPLSPFRQLSQT